MRLVQCSHVSFSLFFIFAVLYELKFTLYVRNDIPVRALNSTEGRTRPREGKKRAREGKYEKKKRE